jgi:dTDP-4-dehydrorhamnose 3,5-epimerase
MSSFSYDCVILVLASAAFDEQDYIRDYQDFRSLVATQRPATSRRRR